MDDGMDDGHHRLDITQAENVLAQIKETQAKLEQAEADRERTITEIANKRQYLEQKTTEIESNQDELGKLKAQLIDLLGSNPAVEEHPADSESHASEVSDEVEVSEVSEVSECDRAQSDDASTHEAPTHDALTHNAQAHESHDAQSQDAEFRDSERHHAADSRHTDAESATGHDDHSHAAHAANRHETDSEEARGASLPMAPPPYAPRSRDFSIDEADISDQNSTYRLSGDQLVSDQEESPPEEWNHYGSYGSETNGSTRLGRLTVWLNRRNENSRGHDRNEQNGQHNRWHADATEQANPNRNPWSQVERTVGQVLGVAAVVLVLLGFFSAWSSIASAFLLVGVGLLVGVAAGLLLSPDIAWIDLWQQIQQQMQQMQSSRERRDRKRGRNQ